MNDPANDNQVSLFDELCWLTPAECEQELWVMLENLRGQNERARLTIRPRPDDQTLHN